MVNKTEFAGVFSEWDKLREVMLGDVRESILPNYQEDWGRYANLKDFIPGNAGVKWIDGLEVP